MVIRGHKCSFKCQKKQREDQQRKNDVVTYHYWGRTTERVVERYSTVIFRIETDIIAGV